jgi:TetR/AcrR family transcriptional repressor of mexJK operon
MGLVAKEKSREVLADSVKMPQPPSRPEAIFEVALELFLTNGFRATSMESIALKARASKETLYRHFGSKEALLVRAVEAISGRVTASAMVADGACPRTALTALGRQLAGLLGNRQVIGIYRLLASEAGRSPQLAEMFADAGPRRGRAALAAMLARFAGRGLLVIHDPAVAAETFSAMILGLRFPELIIGLIPALSDAEQHAIVDRAVDDFLKIHAGRADSPAL